MSHTFHIVLSPILISYVDFLLLLGYEWKLLMNLTNN